jgi:hypothetical protein
LPEKQTAPRGPKQVLPGGLSVDFTTHKLEKIAAGGDGNNKYLEDCVKCALHIRSKVKLDTFVNSALFCFTKGLFLEIPFSEELLDILRVVSAFWGSGA